MTNQMSRSIATCAVLMLVAAASAGSATLPGGRGNAASGHAAKSALPFARVYLATRGCMSCSHCRTNIRQMLRPRTKGAETKFGDDEIEVTYAAPQAVPLRDVIRSLADNRLHDLSLVDVLLEARGTIGSAQGGGATFALAETGQSFHLVMDRSLSRPPDGTPVRLTAVVDGWRKKGTLSLTAREIRPAG